MQEQVLWPQSFYRGISTCTLSVHAQRHAAAQRPFRANPEQTMQPEGCAGAPGLLPLLLQLAARHIRGQGPRVCGRWLAECLRSANRKGKPVCGEPVGLRSPFASSDAERGCTHYRLCPQHL